MTVAHAGRHAPVINRALLDIIIFLSFMVALLKLSSVTPELVDRDLIPIAVRNEHIYFMMGISFWG